MSPALHELRDALAELERIDHTPQVRLALAEAQFRVAIAPCTAAQEAIALLQAAISHDPFAPKLHLHLGRVLHQSGRSRAALAEYRRAVLFAPTSPRAHFLIALALLDLEKPEQELGQVILDALISRSEANLRDAVADLDDLLAARHSGNIRPHSHSRRARPTPPSDGDHATAAVPGVWRAGLLDQLSRVKPQRKRVDELLHTGAAEVRSSGALADYAASCLMLLVAGDNPGDVRRLTRSAAGARLDHPAVQLVEATTRLAEYTDGDTFVEDASRCLTAGRLPIELVCWLHNTRYGAQSVLPAVEALRLLDCYPRSVQDAPCFRELRLAVLDGHARRGWAAGRFSEAKLLWQEAIALDPYRIPVAMNLALLAARTAAADDYDEAWERLTELLYLHPAAAGDVQLSLTDRANLHLALAQHSRQRHCSSAQSDAVPTEEEIAVWLGDRDALEVWLREWDRYYLNARLQFRSPIHQLGVAVDATPAALRNARDSYVRLVETALRGERWIGADAYCALAITTIEQAYDHVTSGAGTGWDPYHGVEKDRADTLLNEALQRGLLLRRMMRVLTDQRDPRHVRLGCAMTRHQLALPWAVLQPLCADQGLIGDDVELVPMFEDDLARLARLTLRNLPDAEAERARRLADVEACRTLLPHNFALRMVQGRLLESCGELDDAYCVAVEALSEAAQDDDPERFRQQLSELAGLVDSIGIAALPEGLHRPVDRSDVERQIAALRQILARFPRSAAARRLLADRLVLLRIDPGHSAAVALLSEGIELAFTDDQRAELRKELASLHTAAADDMVRRRYEDVLESARTRVNRSVKDYNRGPNSITAEAAKDVLREVLAEVTAAQREAEQAGLVEMVERLSKFCDYLRESQALLGSTWG
ncbi:MAG: tetratricopeptide repeat protein [Dehalococcoidia bacterium]